MVSREILSKVKRELIPIALAFYSLKPSNTLLCTTSFCAHNNYYNYNDNTNTNNININNNINNNNSNNNNNNHYNNNKSNINNPNNNKTGKKR